MCAEPMAGRSPSRRAATAPPSWPRELHRAALFLAIAGAFYWMSFAIQGSVVWFEPIGLLFPDLLFAWIAVLLNVAAWPSLWVGLRDLRRRHAGEGNPVLAWRAFLLTLALLVAAIVFLPLRYHATASTEAWLIALYVGALPFLAWTFVPTLLLHGIVFGRVGNYLVPHAKHIARFGAGLLFAVAAVTTLIILQNPESMIFLRTWSVGRGLLPAAACMGYVLIATAMTLHALPERKPAPTRGWALAKTPSRRLSLEHVVYHR